MCSQRIGDRYLEGGVEWTDGSKTVMKTREAIDKAYEMDLDLVVVAENEKPPVCKIMNYSKYRFEQQKKAKERQKKQRESIVQTKEIRLSPVIDIGDFNTRLKNGRKFLQEGNMVKVSIRFRGRMITHKDVGNEVMERYLKEVEDIASIVGKISMDGRQMMMTLKPNNKK